MIYLGLPQWSHNAWSKLGLNDLSDYSRYFNCVEGNTTFYALPRPEIVRRWYDMTHDDFRFCFKFPSVISHQNALRGCDDALDAFFTCLRPLEARIGELWLQLPAAFGPRDLPVLWQFLDALPAGFTYGTEVRHPAFFAKGEEEQALNRGLHQRGVNRVILDSRPVHHARPHSAAVRDAQQKKPKVPLHVLLTAQRPIIRFIGSDDLAENRSWFEPWSAKIAEWSTQCDPYLFIHTPDNADSPQQARALWQTLAQVAELPLPPPDWPQQEQLF